MFACSRVCHVYGRYVGKGIALVFKGRWNRSIGKVIASAYHGIEIICAWSRMDAPSVGRHLGRARRDVPRHRRCSVLVYQVSGTRRKDISLSSGRKCELHWPMPQTAFTVLVNCYRRASFSSTNIIRPACTAAIVAHRWIRDPPCSIGQPPMLSVS